MACNASTTFSTMDSGEPAEETDDPLQGLDQDEVLMYGVLSVTTRGQHDPWYQVSPDPQMATDTTPLHQLSEPDSDALAHAIVALSGRTSAEGKD